MKTSDKGVEFIKRFEAYRSRAYLCPAGVWTCGYGHTSGVTKDTVCDEAQALRWLREDLNVAERAVDACTTSLLQHQFDAMVSFVFNVGSGNFRKSSVWRLLQQKADARAVTAVLRLWNKVRKDGEPVVSSGLDRRRDAEAALYTECKY